MGRKALQPSSAADDAALALRLARVLTAARLQLGLSITAVSAKSGVPFDTAERVCRTGRGHWYTLLRLIRALDVSLAIIDAPAVVPTVVSHPRWTPRSETHKRLDVTVAAHSRGR